MQSPRPLVVLVSEIPPVDTQASSVVLFRHLLALELAGFDIGVVCPENRIDPAQVPATWELIPIPPRRWYYPPYRPAEPFRRMRWLLLDREVRPRLKMRPPHAIIGLLVSEYLVGYAAWLSDRCNCPLFYFYHDRGELLHHYCNPAGAARLRRQNLRALHSRNLRRVWTVTPELIYDEPALREKFRTVYPLPQRIPQAAPPAWRPEFSAHPVIGYAGSLYNEVLAPIRVVAHELEATGGRLHIFTHQTDNAHSLEKEFPGVVLYRGTVKGTVELAECLRDEASAFLVAFPDKVEDMPWSVGCFPSKFTQLVQIGLPGMVLAPAKSTIGRWCESRDWRLYATVSTRENVAELLARLREPAQWTQAAQQSQRYAQEDFNPSALESLVNDDVKMLGRTPQ